MNKKPSRRKTKDRINNRFVRKITKREKETIHENGVIYLKEKEEIIEFSKYEKDDLKDIDKKKVTKLVENKVEKRVKKNEKIILLLIELIKLVNTILSIIFKK